MSPARSNAETDTHAATGVVRVGCVSYLNSKPLIDGLDQAASDESLSVRFDVPSRLLDDLETGEVDVALCPVIDFHRSRTPLVVVPVGGIASDGATLTVRLFSQVPFTEVDTLHADTDSHTSVVLARLLLEKLHHTQPRVVDFDAREQVAENRVVAEPATVLLIGDKVVTGTSRAHTYPYQMDLGEAWRELTGLPFVFAVWMAGAEATLCEVPAKLAETRRANESDIDRIVNKYAANHGWPLDQARSYLADHLQFAIGPREIEAMKAFADMAAAAGLIPEARPLRLWRE